MVKTQQRAKSAPKSIKTVTKALSKKSSKASSTKKVSVASSPTKSSHSPLKKDSCKPKWNGPNKKVIETYTDPIDYFQLNEKYAK
jgi:hypothetical protein